MRFSWGALFSFLVALVFALAVWQARDWDFRTKLFPWAIGIPLMALALLNTLLELRGAGRKAAGAGTPGPEPAVGPALARRRTLRIIGWMLGFFVAIWWLGWPAGLSLATFLFLKVASREGWFLSILITALAWAFIFSFDRFLHIPFSQGQLSIILEKMLGG